MARADTRLERGMDNLRGRVLGMVESFGLEERHERAIKQTFKSLTYDLQAQLADDIQHDIEESHAKR